MHGRQFFHATALLVLVAFLGFPAEHALAAPTENVLYNFQNGLDGAQPSAGLIADRSGSLYGTTFSGGAYSSGTVFQLTPPISSGGSWTESVLYTFQNGADGAFPYARLIFDENGNLYGTTTGGGMQPDCFECGTVFKLTRPTNPGDAWTESILYSVNGADGASPYGPLLLDEDGNLFGTTRSGGTYFEGSVF